MTSNSVKSDHANGSYDRTYRTTPDIGIIWKDQSMKMHTPPLSLTAPSNRTLGEHIAHQLRHAILTDQLKPGQRIMERRIAEIMETSRGPVRDALRLLEREGLVVRYPHRGTFVARLTTQDLEEIHSLRVALETLALDYAIKRATDEQVDELDKLVQAMSVQAKREYTPFDATDLDLEFHHTLCRISGHKRVLAAWEALNPQIRMLLLSHRTLQPADFRQRAVEWHRQLAAAVRNGDAKSARTLMQKHLAASFESVADLSAEDQTEIADSD